MGQSEIIKFQAQWIWFPQGDVADALPFILIILAMTTAPAACWRAVRS